MRFENQVMMLRRTFSEIADNQFKKVGHCVKGRVHLKRTVMLKLQKREMKWKAAIANAPRSDATLNALEGALGASVSDRARIL